MSIVRAHPDKPALVLLHGWGMHGGVWTDLVARLGNGRDVLAPDLPGHGASPMVEPYAVDAVVDRLAAAAPGRCVLAGWSLGGQLALAWARRHPQQVQRLILIATTPRFVRAADWPHGMSIDVLTGFAESLARDAAATLQRFLLLETQGDAQARAVARRLEAVLASRPLASCAVLEQTLRWLQATDLRAMLPAIAQPALVLHGDADRITPPAAGEFLAATLPRGRIRLIAGAAHAPFISAPDAVCRLMADFCDEQ